MALGVYVGSLTRFYGGAGNQGAVIGRDAEQVRPSILAWRAALNERLRENLSAPLDWEESPKGPSFRAWPGWGGIAALVLWAAYAEHPAIRRLAVLRDGWENDPALVRSRAQGFRSRYSHLVRNVELWLPGPFDVTFECEDVVGHRITIGSVPSLQRQLDDLNTTTWKAGRPAVKAWGAEPPPDEAPLELRARYGFAAMMEAVRRAARLRLPMKLDW